MTALTDTQLERYARHLILDEVGEAGQEKLLAARVLVVGAGGLGSPMLLYLAAAGVGTIGIVDDDRVDLTNLQRQIIHGTASLGRTKVASAKETIAAINPEIKVETHAVRLTAANAAALMADYDLVADGSDNFATRYLLNDACHLWPRPWSPRRCCASTLSSRSSRPISARRIPATAASSATRRRPTWCRAARRPASSARSPAAPARCRRPRC